MAQFLNQEPNPQEKDSAKGATLKPAPASVDWNDADDGGVSALERASLMAQAKTPATSAGDSFAAGVGNSIVAAAIRKASAPAFMPEQGFDAKKYLGTDSRTKLYTPSAEEIEYLHGAASREEYDYRVQDMLTQRNRDRMMSDNVAVGVAGMLLGDSPFILAPMAAGGIAGRTGLAVRSAIRAGDVATAVYAQDQLGQSAGVTALIAGVSGIDQLWDMSRAAKAAAKLRTGREPAFDPDAPTTRTARDTNVTGVGARTLDSIMDEVLAEPITVQAKNVAGVSLKAHHVTQYLRSTGTLTRGQEVLLDAIEPVVRDVDFTLMAGTDRVVARSRYTFNPDNLTAPGTVALRAPAAAET
ncbi:internal virion protein C [Klebsiella phage vB_KpnP_Ou2]|nr:internal virion protein C [Klebsiella phage vB_KpnP_Ou2]